MLKNTGKDKLLFPVLYYLQEEKEYTYFMRTGRKPRQIIRNVILYLLTAVLFFATVPEIPVQASGVTDDEAEQEYTEEELYDLDDGDGEYWKYYDTEGNWVREQETLEGDGYTSNSAEPSGSEDSIVSPYTGKSYVVLPGYDISHAVDVSKYQEDIDWAKVKADGVDSVIIRCAYRGYGSSGSLVTDPIFTKHIEGALAAGLHVGVYIYSQAITEAEGVGEANKCLDVCADYLDQLDLPVVMDVEYAEPDGKAGGRLYDADLSKSEQTAICQAFARTIYDAGYQPMIYANRSMLTNDMNASVLSDEGEQIWLAHYTTNTDYSASPYILWQYSSSGTVSGISGAADMDFIFTKDLEQEVPVWKNISASGTSVKLTWENVAGADGYEIQRSTDGETWSSLAALEAGAAVSYMDTAVNEGNTYSYQIRAYFDEEGSTVYGNFSEVISAATAAPKKLPAPELKEAVSAGYDRIKVSWDAIDGTEGYRLYRKVSGGSWKKLKDTTSLSYADTTAVTGTQYYYTVRGYYKVNGEIIWGKYDKTGISGKAVMPAPELKSAESTDYNKIKVSWGEVDGAQGYRIYRKVSGESWKKLKDTTSLSYTDTTAVTGTKYYYTVRGYRKVDGEIIWGKYSSKGISGKAIPSTPSVTLSSATAGKVKVSWKEISGATGYVVYRQDLTTGEWKRIKNITSPGTVSYTANGTSGATVYYAVRAYRTVGDKSIYSNFSEDACIKVK